MNNDDNDDIMNDSNYNTTSNVNNVRTNSRNNKNNCNYDILMQINHTNAYNEMQHINMNSLSGN